MRDVAILVVDFAESLRRIGRAVHRRRDQYGQICGHAADAAVEATVEEMEVHDRHADEIEREGVMPRAFALEPAATATSLRGDLVIDGPFTEAKEVIVGVYIIEAPDLDSALRVARRNPILQRGGGLEVRPIAGERTA